jgi:RNA polymerase sigma-70 factor (ECF subfamily)
LTVSDGSDRNSPGFPTTQWSLVARAGGEDAAGPREALSELLPRYLPALRAHLASKYRRAASQIDDLLQGFVSEKILERDLLQSADRERGRFRSLLLKSLERYVVSVWRHQSAKKRSAESQVSLEATGGEHLATTPATAPSAFDVAWAKEMLAETLRRMEQECQATGRTDVWGVFEARLVAPILRDEPVVGYDELVEKYKLATPRRATNTLITGKRLFVRTLRAVVGEYTPDDEIEAEIAGLQEILSLGGGSSRDPIAPGEL